MGRVGVGDCVDSTGLIQMIVKGDVQGFTSSQQGLMLHVILWTISIKWRGFLFVCLCLYERCFSLIQTHRNNNNDTVKQVEYRDTQSKWRQKSRTKKQTQLNWEVDPPPRGVYCHHLDRCGYSRKHGTFPLASTTEPNSLSCSQCLLLIQYE